MATANQQAITILRRDEVQARTGLSRSTIYDRIPPKSLYYYPTFPRSIDAGCGRAVGWIEGEVNGWIQGRIIASCQAA